MSRGEHFTDVEDRLVNKLSETPKDVRFSVLFRAVAGRWPEPTEDHRRQQQRIGPHISRINAKLASRRQRIVPGVLRHTYRLTRIAS